RVLTLPGEPQAPDQADHRGEQREDQGGTAERIPDEAPQERGLGKPRLADRTGRRWFGHYIDSQRLGIAAAKTKAGEGRGGRDTPPKPGANSTGTLPHGMRPARTRRRPAECATAGSAGGRS